MQSGALGATVTAVHGRAGSTRPVGCCCRWARGWDREGLANLPTEQTRDRPGEASPKDRVKCPQAGSAVWGGPCWAMAGRERQSALWRGARLHPLASACPRATWDLLPSGPEQVGARPSPARRQRARAGPDSSSGKTSRWSPRPTLEKPVAGAGSGTCWHRAFLALLTQLLGLPAGQWHPCNVPSDVAWESHMWAGPELGWDEAGVPNPGDRVSSDPGSHWGDCHLQKCPCGPEASSRALLRLARHPDLRRGLSPPMARGRRGQPEVPQVPSLCYRGTIGR